MKKIILIILFLLYCFPCYSTTVTLQDGVDGYAGTADCSMQKESGNTNNGTATTLLFSDSNASYYDYPVVRFDLSSIPSNATISSAVLYLYATWDTGAACTINAHRIYKIWNGETNVTWNDWDTTTKEWGTVGCDNAADGQADNSSDGSGYDRTSTADATYSKTAWIGATWFSWNLTSLAQLWVNGTISNNGVRISSTLADCVIDNGTFYSSEYLTDTTKRPKITITYTVPITTTRSVMLFD